MFPRTPTILAALVAGTAILTVSNANAAPPPMDDDCPGAMMELTIGEIEFNLDDPTPNMVIFGTYFDNGDAPTVEIGVDPMALPVLDSGADYIEADLTGIPEGDYTMVVSTGTCKRQIASFDLSLVDPSVDDADADPTNELNNAVGLNGTSLEVTDAGGTLSADLSSLIDDADADATNELNSAVGLNGNLLEVTDAGGTLSADLSSLIDDADADATNELNSAVGLNGTSLEVTDAGGTLSANLGSLINDADADPTNELNTGVVLNGTTLEVTDAGGTKSADLSSLAAADTDWTEAGGNVYRQTGNVGIGTNSPSTRLHVSGELLANANNVVSPITGGGGRFMWLSGKRALRAGEVVSSEWDNANVGLRSAALGEAVTASGQASVALGSQNTVSGSASFVSGAFNDVSGNFAHALGLELTASGTQSIAMGRRASTNGFSGSFVFGDSSTASVITNTAGNQFRVRAVGGTQFFTDTALTAGVTLAPGAGAWASVSDRNMKENFESEDGETVLEKLAEMEISSWNYKAQDPTIRHIGPMAQDFYSAFRLGESDTKITTTDIDGINMLAIQALERRTATLSKENEALKTQLQAARDIFSEQMAAHASRNAKLEAELASLRASMRSVESILTSLQTGLGGTVLTGVSSPTDPSISNLRVDVSLAAESTKPLSIPPFSEPE